ncbi:MAG: hypothetical protein EBW54_06080, partial [Betaproteobacteria bacterium]|nr:hypothetical protein [Betaproteobacteria bacterium]
MNDQHNDRAPLLSQEDASRSSAGPITSVHDRGQETPVVILASTSIYRKELLASLASAAAAPSAGGVGIPGNWIMPVMSIGQVAEIATMAVLLGAG